MAILYHVGVARLVAGGPAGLPDDAVTACQVTPGALRLHRLTRKERGDSAARRALCGAATLAVARVRRHGGGGVRR